MATIYIRPSQPEDHGSEAFEWTGERASHYPDYLADNRVFYQGNFYKALQNIEGETTAPDQDPSNWILISGTEEDPYIFTDLNVIPDVVNNIDKIIFLDGDFIVPTSYTAVFKGLIYEAKNPGKAVIKSVTGDKWIDVGSDTDNYAVAKFKNLSFQDIGSPDWQNPAINIHSAVNQYHEFQGCEFKLYSADYGFLGKTNHTHSFPATHAKFTNCFFDLIRHKNGASDGNAPSFYRTSNNAPNGFELKNCILKFSSDPVASSTAVKVFNDTQGNQETKIEDTIIF